MEVQNEIKIKTLVLPHLSVGKRGKKSGLCLVKVFLLILKRLKTGSQWRELSTREFFDEPVPWQTIYYYFNKWCKDGSFLKFGNNYCSTTSICWTCPLLSLMAHIRHVNVVVKVWIKVENHVKPVIA